MQAIKKQLRTVCLRTDFLKMSDNRIERFRGYVSTSRSQADYLEPFNFNLGCDLSLKLYYSCSNNVLLYGKAGPSVKRQIKEATTRVGLAESIVYQLIKAIKKENV